MANVTRLNVNGRTLSINADPRTALLWVLRDQLDITGPKYGCGEGQCGACTVLIDGVARRSCITPVASVAKKQITTIEGLEKDGRLHPVQDAFVKDDAMQCAYCIPGMIMSAVSLLRAIPHPSDKEIVQHMQGNMCRCGTYPRILAAIHRAAKVMR